jgi:hypothetical protein
MVLTVDSHAWSYATGDPVGPRLRLSVSPLVARAPALLRIQVYVAPAPDNRLLEIVTESGDYFRSSSILLEGERASRSHRVEYRSVPAGAYTVLAVLIGDDGEVNARVEEGVLVVD